MRSLGRSKLSEWLAVYLEVKECYSVCVGS